MKLVANNRRGVMINMNNKHEFCRGNVVQDTQGAKKPVVLGDLYGGKDYPLKVNELHV